MLRPNLPMLIALTLSASVACAAHAADFAFSPPIVSLLPKGHTPTAIRVADLDGDGTLDAVASGRNWDGEPDGVGRVSVLRGDGTGQFVAWQEVLVDAGHTEDVAIADVTADGTLDLVVSVASRRGRLAIARGRAGGTFDPPIHVDIERQPRGVAVGDIDNDGDLDVAAINYGSASLQVLTSEFATGGSLALRETRRLGRYLGAVPNPLSANVLDLDGDGTRDVLVTMLGGGRVGVHRGAARGLLPAIDWKPAPIANESPAIIGASIADYDGDGDADVALPALLVTQSQKMIVMRNAGDASLAEQSVHDIGTFFYTWSSTPIDVDGDGRIDVAVGTALSGAVWFMRNETASPTSPIAFTAQPLAIPFGVFVRDLTSGDVDGDGDFDLVGIDIASSKVFVLLNQTPQGGVAGEVVSRPPPVRRPKGASAPQPMPTHVDFNRDGQVDAVDVAAYLEGAALAVPEVSR